MHQHKYVLHNNFQTCKKCILFFITQDTVVALDALSKYSTIIRDKPNIAIHFAASGQERDLTISDEDQIKVNTFNLREAADTVYMKVSGKGCVLAQVCFSD